MYIYALCNIWYTRSILQIIQEICLAGSLAQNCTSNASRVTMTSSRSACCNCNEARPKSVISDGFSGKSPSDFPMGFLQIQGKPGEICPLANPLIETPRNAPWIIRLLYLIDQLSRPFPQRVPMQNSRTAPINVVFQAYHTCCMGHLGYRVPIVNVSIGLCGGIKTYKNIYS